MGKLTVKARVTGKVQGVGFRYWTRSRANFHNLTGWVTNDPSGSVTALFIGDKDSVTAMIEELWGGPGAARVQDVQTEIASDQDGATCFQILR